MEESQSVESKHKEGYKLLLEVRDELEQIETGQARVFHVVHRRIYSLTSLRRTHPSLRRED